MKTLEIVVNNVECAQAVANQYGVTLEMRMVGEAYAKLARIHGTKDALIDFVDEFFIGSKVHMYYVNEILELA